MNELELAVRRHKLRLNNEVYEEKKDNNTISKIFSKILLSIIFILLSSIYIHLDEQNLNNYKEAFFESNITFAKINNWYHETFGSLMPTFSMPNEVLVNSTNEPIMKEEYLNGYKITNSLNGPVTSVASGIIVFMDKKENYGNTIIIQGIDGVDIWYGNVSDSNYKLYDYVDKDSIIGNSIGEYYYNVFMKDGKTLTYDEYLENQN